ncbi:MAG: hypothetical protein A2W05_05265 [Candidatus Schekmanbacteria bacterium RBG_16_38_10]|uniref:Ig-like domain-containing protein n=1 Tax=Candidatus Schekmanbacteria bacterium RBG_16_38_10 TaxID=1817879 RepID=A0A1F7RSA6_9BACT|nr:MAG: hypothetical protein A2W05_05265 [Candidatus Schekmanbacteria bacterium RBG_16_38_10]
MKNISTLLIVMLVIATICSCQQLKQKQEPQPVNPSNKEILIPQVKKGYNNEPQTIYTNNRYINVTTDKADLDGMLGIELWHTTDGGENWANHGLVEGKPDVLKFLAPTDGKYGFLKVIVDKDGKRSITPKYGIKPEIFVVVDTTPPVVELLTPNGGEIFTAGATTVITWIGEDANLLPNTVRIEVSSNNGKNWILISRDESNDGKYYWDIPRTSSQEYRIKVTVSDIAGNVSSDESDANFIVDGLPPEARIVGPATSNKQEVEIRYIANDVGGAGLGNIKLYYTINNGTTWEYYGEDNDLTSPIKFKALDGIYGLKVVAVDKKGNATETPVAGTPPPFTVTIDSTPPQIQLITLNDKATYAGNFSYDIIWTAKDNIHIPTNSISLYYSDDKGTSWKEIVKDIENNGVYKWTTPNSNGDKYRLKIKAYDLMKNTSEVISDPFTIDTRIPEAVAIGPKKSSVNTVSLEYSIKNSGTSPIKEITIWITYDDGKTWARIGETNNVSSPYIFTKNDGTYGLYVTCVSELGLKTESSQKPPTEGTSPQLTLTIDSSPPQLTMLNFDKGGYFKGGERKDILWDVKEQNPDLEGLTILYSPDGGTRWEEVMSKLDIRSGKYGWTIPNKSSKTSFLRFIAIDTLGNKTIKDSEKLFVVDTDQPQLNITKKPPVSKFHTINISYEATDETSGISKVEVFGKTSDDSNYKKLLSAVNITDSITVDVDKDGKWSFALIATDTAGNISKEQSSNMPPDFEVVVDTIKPNVELKRFKALNNKPTYINTNGEIEWTATDTVSKKDKLLIRVEYSADSGTSWYVIKDRLTNEGKFSMAGYMDISKKYRVKVTATDEAGNEAFDESADFELMDIPLPQISLRGITDGQVIPVESPSEISYLLTSNEKIQDLLLQIRQVEPEQTDWNKIKFVSGEKQQLLAPSKPGLYAIRIAGKDSYNRDIYSNEIRIKVIVPPLAIKVATPEVRITVDGIAKLDWKATDAKIDRSKLTVEISPDGINWEQSKADIGFATLTIIPPSKVGKYFLRIKLTGQEKPIYSDTVTLIVEEKPAIEPSIQLASFRGGEVAYAGNRKIIFINTQGGVKFDDITIELSDKSGAEGTWKAISKSDLQPMTGGFNWTIPNTPGKNYRLRITWKDVRSGKLYTDTSATDFTIEQGQPTDIAIKLIDIPLKNLKGGEQVIVNWTSSVKGIQKVVTLYLYTNGRELEQIAAGLPSEGSFTWTTRKIDLTNCEIRAKLENAGVVKWDTTSKFTIDSSPPDWDASFQQSATKRATSK